MAKETYRIKNRDWLLLVGLMLAPMTGLRIWKIGPAEVLCLIWCLPYLCKLPSKSVRSYKIKFWICFIAAILIGTVYGIAFYPNETAPLGVITYLYLGIIFEGITIGLEEKEYEEIDRLFNVFCVITTIWYMFLFLFSLASPSFLGAPLWYGGRVRFSGGGENPHQLAICMGAVIFGNIRLLFKATNGIGRRVFYGMCVLISS